MRIILSVILILVLLYLFNYFVRHNIKFYSKSESCKLLRKSDYFNNFNEYDLKTRNLKNKSKKDILNYYCKKIYSFTYLERKALYWILDLIKNKRNDNFMSKQWNFVKFKDIEHNFPHTHLNAIFLPKNMIDNIVYYYQNNSSLLEMKNTVNTLIHEKVHVLQRDKKKLFNDLFNHWHFIQGKINGIREDIIFVRNNPDSEQSKYIFSYKGKYIWFDAFFIDEAYNISDVQYRGYFLEKLDDGSFKITEKVKDIKEIDEYNEFFGNINNNYYHPNEISAELITMYYLDELGLQSGHQSKSFDILKKWIHKNLI